MSDRTFAEFAASLTFANGGAFELEPWQLAMIERLERGERPLEHGELELAHRRAGRRWRAAQVLAAAAIGGHDVTIASPTREGAEALYRLAADLLERYGREAGADVALAHKRLQRARKQPDSDRGRATA